MIKSNELRRYNFIYIGSNKTHKEVTTIFCNGVCVLGDNKTHYCPDINPVPLTAEILKKAGFTKDTDNIFDITDYSLGEVVISEDFTIMGQKMPQMDWVHQLQNLYLALTQTELTINL